MPGPRDYTPTTRTALAALSRGTCYFPDCDRPVIVLLDGEPYVDVQIAHIYDANVGNRYHPTMSDDERRAFSNLILLCKPHHDLVDKRHPERYRAEDLHAWKRGREGDEIVIDDPSAVSEDVIEEALSQVTIIHIKEGGLNLGGAGGNAMGAAGGGGGVIGSGTGGAGGPGSTIHMPDGVVIDVHGKTGSAPGTGGGAGGLLGSGVLLRRAHPDEGREGRGYSAGIDGQEGQPTSIGDSTGEFFIEAPGGRAGLAGDGPRLASDILGLSLLTLANSAEVRDGLLFLLGAGWQNLQVLNLGDRSSLLVVLVFEAGGLEVGDYTAAVYVEDPERETMSTVSFPVTVEEKGDVVRIPRFVTVDVQVSSFGVWRVSVMNDARMLGIVDVMIKRAGVLSAHPFDA